MSRILVTGASKSLGRAVVNELAARDHDAIAAAGDQRSLADLPVSQALRLDVTNQNSIDQAVAAAGPVDVLVSNAGEIIVAWLADSPISEIERLFAVNTIGAAQP